MKSKIRKKQILKRKKFNLAYVTIQSYEIYKKLIPYLKNISSIHIYFPMNNEIDTRQIIRLCRAKGIKVILPRTDFKTNTLTNYVIYDWDDLEPTRFNMLEPKINCEAFNGSPDLIVVPGVAFDFNKNRLGYGGGYYDRFLSSAKSLKIAVAYDEQIVESLPTEIHDIKMDLIITPNKIIK